MAKTKNYGIGTCPCGSQFTKTGNQQKWCLDCARVLKRKQQNAYAVDHRQELAAKARKWREENLERARETKRRFRQENRLAVRESDANKYRLHGDAIRKRAADWYAKNRERVLAKMSTEEGRRRSRERMRELRKDPHFRLHSNVSRSIRTSLKHKSRRSWELLVGYTQEQLAAHLERQFSKGMSWGNMGKWHIDHIVPRSAFVYQRADEPSFKACWAITNLRPMWGVENIRKHANRTHLL